MSIERPLESLTDDELLAELADLLRQSHGVEARLVAHIAEVDARHLYARRACSSMFLYCTDVLHLAECVAYDRIAVARAAREHPVLLEMLADGRLHLTGIAKLAPHLTPENRDALLARAVHKTKRQILELVAELAPRPDVPTVVRKLPDRAAPAPVESESNPELGPARVDAGLGEGFGSDPGCGLAAALRPAPLPSPVAVRPRPAFEPLSPGRYKFAFTASVEFREKLEKLRALMRSDVPDGDFAAVIERAVTLELERREARRFAKTPKPRKEARRKSSSPLSRYVPAAVRRAVYRRDGGQCCFVDEEKRRCPERHRLEYHHQHPFGLGGGPDPDNICLMCGPHNRLLAEIDYGKEKMSRYWRSGREHTPAEKSGKSLATS
jgi:hypothetical protein